MTTSNISTAKEVAQQAGEILVKHFGNVEITNNKSKRAVDVVTKLDIEIENFIASELEKHDPSIGFTEKNLVKEKNPISFGLLTLLTEPLIL